MIEIIDTSPDIDVAAVEYKRLLGYPRDAAVSDRAEELMDWARGWYRMHGRPWAQARQADGLELTGDAVTIDGVPFSSPRLSQTLRNAAADAAIVVAVSAGPELEAEAQQLWRDGKPDEYFFLEVYGSAVVEHLVTMTGARLCAWAESRHMAVLPHYSPGYPEWSIEEQPRLLDLINRLHPKMPAPVDVMDSGMLRPKKSLLAVFGITRHVDRVQRLTALTPCENCSYLPCQYRRTPYRRAPMPANPELSALSQETSGDGTDAASPTTLDHDGHYTVNLKALQRWSQERLSLSRRADGGVDATFRYEGTTCTNMGRALKFDYRVTLGPPQDGYPIREQRCAPAEGDAGYTYMCRYLSNREQLLVAIDQEQPLNGKPLNDVLGWTRAASGAGCYCEPESRQHKWGLVLETIHFALARERGD